MTQRDPIAARTVLVASSDATEVMHAIDRAALRLQSLTRATAAEYASAAVLEIGDIIRAKQRYDAQEARTAEPQPEPEEVHAPQPLVLNHKRNEAAQ